MDGFTGGFGIRSEATKLVEPTYIKEGFEIIPYEKWEDVVDLHSLKQVFNREIITRVNNPEKYKSSGSDIGTQGVPFMHVKCEHLWATESALRDKFNLARTYSPCILFFDELIEELDKQGGIHIIGATNRSYVMSQLVLKHRRFWKHLYVPMPNQEERGLILKALVREKIPDTDVDLDAIARREGCDELSGGDLRTLVSFPAN
ncbi:hypothetical protein L1987_23589 [Smallanthus sonchifolius]|uniref:Uncharacterized protein n=1 Tax=Smallanthus sonchifolius TaxID=185202 RepID=A0ACB9IJJ0_9ASTR|nr:hypothetical protein L1987_23589 [Smallanthus sonchifolius]